MDGPAPRVRARLRAAQRLGGDAVTATVARGRSRSAGLLRMQFLRNGLTFARIALVVPKRYAKRSVDRSRLRRVLRESFRTRQAAWNGYDCVIRLRATHERDRDFAQLSATLFDPGP